MIATIGLDIAKQVFQAHGADKSERQVSRGRARSPVSSCRQPARRGRRGAQRSKGLYTFFLLSQNPPVFEAVSVPIDPVDRQEPR